MIWNCLTRNNQTTMLESALKPAVVIYREDQLFAPWVYGIFGIVGIRILFPDFSFDAHFQGRFADRGLLHADGDRSLSKWPLRQLWLASDLSHEYPDLTNSIRRNMHLQATSRHFGLGHQTQLAGPGGALRTRESSR